MEQLVGQTLGQYQITQELGRGGMAVVYKAYQPALQRYVAIKVLPPQLGLDPGFVKRFQHEAVAAARLKHPNIVTVHDVSIAGNVNYIVMELIEGQPLSTVIRQGGAMPPDRVARIIGQVAQALDYAHRQGFIHRDIKPSNIMLDADDHAILTDFGIAKAKSGTHLTQTGALIGTPEYMSPEQVRGLTVDHRADLYSLGIVAYEMLAGRVPFSGDTASVLYKQAHEMPPPIHTRAINVPASISNVIDRALAKDPNQRFASAGEFARALASAAPAAAPVRPTGAYAPPAAGTPGARALRSWGIWAVGGVAALICIIGALAIVGLAGTAMLGRTSTVAQAPAVTATSVVVAAAPRATSTASPQATQGVATTTAAASTATVAATATPVPTKTSTPTPTKTFTPTPSPTPSCPPVTGPFASIWQSAKDKLGCATNSAHEVWMAEETFQQGRMFWRKDNELYVSAVYSSGRWGTYPGDWKEGDPEFTCGTPSSPPTPKRGFGRAWCKYTEIRTGLGNATTEEIGYNSTVQDFARGMIVRSSTGTAFVLYSGDGWETR